jgi:hypothetical protein
MNPGEVIVPGVFKHGYFNLMRKILVSIMDGMKNSVFPGNENLITVRVTGLSRMSRGVTTAIRTIHWQDKSNLSSYTLPSIDSTWCASLKDRGSTFNILSH